MNLWQCDFRDEHGRCDNECVGVGGAIGLRAIGWYFRVGHGLFCPVHRPDGIDGKGKYLECRKKKCPQCKATKIAEKWQSRIEEDEGIR